jgi:excisionase family DNA binding protein
MLKTVRLVKLAGIVKLPMALSMEMVSNDSVGKRLLNVEEAAGYLGLKVDTVYKKARLRELPFVKVGRALRFDKQALDRLIEQHTIKTID